MKTSRSFYTTAVICLSVGFLTGSLSERHRDQATSPTPLSVLSAADTQNSDKKQGGDLLSDQRTESTAQNALEEAEETALRELEFRSGLKIANDEDRLVIMPTSLIDHLSAAGKIRSIDSELFTADMDLASSLQISAHEQSTLEQGWCEFRKQLRSLETQSAHFEEKEDGSLVIRIPDLSQQIEYHQIRFAHQTESTLGKNRAGILLASIQFESIIEATGMARQIIVSPESSGDGNWRYHTVVQSPKGKRTYVGETIPSGLQHLTKDLEIVAF